jgi:hypothetical protein
MDKIVKKIPAFFLLIAGLAIVAHMVIPHDHHPVDQIVCHEDPSPFSNEQTHHTSFPFHCHVCNDLTSEKAATLMVVIKNIRNNYFVIDEESNSTIPYLYSSESAIFDPETIICNSDPSDSSSLRAPPSFT